MLGSIPNQTVGLQPTCWPNLQQELPKRRLNQLYYYPCGYPCGYFLDTKEPTMMVTTGVAQKKNIPRICRPERAPLNLYIGGPEAPSTMTTYYPSWTQVFTLYQWLTNHQVVLTITVSIVNNSLTLRKAVSDWLKGWSSPGSLSGNAWHQKEQVVDFRFGAGFVVIGKSWRPPLVVNNCHSALIPARRC